MELNGIFYIVPERLQDRLTEPDEIRQLLVCRDDLPAHTCGGLRRAELPQPETAGELQVEVHYRLGLKCRQIASADTTIASTPAVHCTIGIVSTAIETTQLGTDTPAASVSCFCSIMASEPASKIAAPL